MTVYISFLLILFLLASLRRISVGLRDSFVIMISILFVGFRFEMAYDWPYYKEMFDYLGQYDFTQFIKNFQFIQLAYPSESGFLFLAHAFSSIVPDYEWFQAFIYLIFLAGFWSLGRAIGCQNIGAAFVVVHLFLLFTLEFSTVRQAFAIGLFNFGLAAYLKEKKISAFGFFIASTLFQVSTLIYIFALMLAANTKKKIWITAIAGLVLVIPLSFPSFLLQIATAFPARAAEKLIFYITEREVILNWGELAFAFIFYSLMVIMSFRMALIWRHIDDQRLRVLLRLVLVLSIFALGFLFVHVFRNRIFYEVVIIFSLLAFSRYHLSRTRFVLPVIAMGIVFTAISFVRPSSFMYIPYQNYFTNAVSGWEGNGNERNDRYRELLMRKR